MSAQVCLTYTRHDSLQVELPCGIEENSYNVILTKLLYIVCISSDCCHRECVLLTDCPVSIWLDDVAC